MISHFSFDPRNLVRTACTGIDLCPGNSSCALLLSYDISIPHPVVYTTSTKLETFTNIVISSPFLSHPLDLPSSSSTHLYIDKLNAITS